jgi:hypothetical protein
LATNGPYPTKTKLGLFVNFVKTCTF